MKIITKNLSVLILVVITTGVGFFGGSLWTENKILKAGTVNVKGTTVPTDAAQVPEGPTVEQLAKAPAPNKDERIRGNKNAKVVLVEYSDHECPFCARFHGTMVDLLKEMGDKVAWVYRDYPLSFHPNAQKAAEGGVCVTSLAGNEAFWKYADSLAAENTKSGKLSPEAITQAAQAAGVNEAAFKEWLDGDKFAQTVKDSLGTGSSAGIQGTPGTIIFVNGEAKELIPGALPLESVKASVEKYL